MLCAELLRPHIDGGARPHAAHGEGGHAGAAGAARRGEAARP